MGVMSKGWTVSAFSRTFFVSERSLAWGATIVCTPGLWHMYNNVFKPMQARKAASGRVILRAKEIVPVFLVELVGLSVAMTGYFILKRKGGLTIKRHH